MAVYTYTRQHKNSIIIKKQNTERISFINILALTYKDDGQVNGQMSG